jgi:competence protein ComGC
MRSLIGLLIVALIVALAYKLYFSKLQSQETGTPAQTITIVGVKNDLLAIAQSERAYQAEHGSYASLDELKSSGAMTMVKPGRDGYTYNVETSSTGFRVVAHCPAATSPGCSNWMVDQSMEVSPLQ